MTELRRRTEQDGFPPVLLVTLGSPEEGRSFFAKRWPEARVVSDPNKEIYAAFGLTRGSLGQLLGPSSWLAGAKAALSGHGIGKPVGDPLMLSGQFLVAGDQVLWSERHDTPGATRDYDGLLAAWRAAVAQAGAPSAQL